MKNRDYWTKRFIQEKAIGIKQAQAYELELNKRLNKMLAIYDQALKCWYNRYSHELNIPKDKVIKILKGIEYKHFDMTLEEFERKAKKGGFDKELDKQYFQSQVARLKQLESQLKQEATDLFSVEQFKMQDELVNQYQNTYLHNTFNIQAYRGHYDLNFAKLNTEKLKIVVSNPWKNSKNYGNFSDRLWGTYTEELPSQLMDSVLRSTLTGASYQKVKAEFHKRFTGMKSSHVHRLVVTEMNHIQEEATALSYKEQKVERYIYLAVFERNTCSDCGHLDSKVFYLKDRSPGVNYPLIHPHCRCTTAPYYEDDTGSDKRMINGKVMDDMSFDDFQAMLKNS